ncbi:MAG: S41 family peptidase [Cyclobacteriaceae bacterium]|jgi:carboxyl-terminal processing protease|nr:S41 family peptidase [Cyclobacteriaceae bacterium]
MKRKKWLVAAVVLMGLGALAMTPPAERYFEIAKNLEIFASLFREVNTLYVDEVSPQKMMRTGIDAMLNSLDPYTNYISEDEIEDYRTQNTGQYGGIGALTRQFGNRTVVTMVYEGFPAFKNGLRIGDEILKLDEVELARLTPEEANQLMRGQLGTTIKLTVKRWGEKNPLTLEFRREKIKINHVPYAGLVDGEVGYVQVTEFTQDVGREVRQAIASLKEKGAKSIVLDLRDNPGGLLMEAVNICNIFLPKDKEVVTTKGKIAERNVTYRTLNSPTDVDLPVVVLINRGSASASEIVAGTLQDYDRAVILGERSFGKGLVQEPRPLSYNSQVKITTAKYYTPTGRCIQVLDYAHRREDGSVESIPDSLKKEFKTARGRSVYEGGGIDPDIKRPAKPLSSLAIALYSQGWLFDYATEYAARHSTLVPARQFALTDAEYQDFVGWIKAKPFRHEPAIEAELKALEEEAKHERYYEELKPHVMDLRQKLAESRKHEYTLFKDQIKELLEREIVSRYYFEAGVAEVGFQYDEDVKQAVQLLRTPTEYKKILKL